MTGQGRKRKPDHIKLVQGTLKKSRVNENQPEPEIGKPQPFEILTKDGKKYFDKLSDALFKMKVLTEADSLALTMLAEAVADYYEARKALDKKVYGFKNKHGDAVLRKRPEWSIMNECRLIIFRLLGSFGLDPSSRARLNVIPEPEPSKRESPENPWENL